MNNIFPVTKKFSDIKSKESTLVLKVDSTFYKKSFRKGSIFIVYGWREIEKMPYLVISKGTWEGLIKYDDEIKTIFSPLIDSDLF